MKKTPEKIIFETIVCGIALALLFEPVWRLNDVLSMKVDNIAVCFFVVPIIGAVFYSSVLFSDTLKQALIKYVISLPVNFLLFSWFLKIDFSRRALNWIHPYYGESSAGGNFAGFIMFSALGFTYIIAIVAALCCTKFVKNEKVRAALFVIQKCGLVLSILVLILTFFINAVMRPKFPLAG